MLQPRVLDLNEVLAGMEKLLPRVIGEDVRLEVRPGTDLARVSADPGQIEQVILNLVVNARDAMPQGGSLILRTATAILEGGVPAVRIEISDTGVGVPPEHHVGMGEVVARLYILGFGPTRTDQRDDRFVVAAHLEERSSKIHLRIGVAGLPAPASSRRRRPWTGDRTSGSTRSRPPREALPSPSRAPRSSVRGRRSSRAGPPREGGPYHVAVSSLARVARVALSPWRAGLLTVPIRVQGRELAFLFDTGAGLTTVDSSLARDLGLVRLAQDRRDAALRPVAAADDVIERSRVLNSNASRHGFAIGGTGGGVKAIDGCAVHRGAMPEGFGPDWFRPWRGPGGVEEGLVQRF